MEFIGPCAFIVSAQAALLHKTVRLSQAALKLAVNLPSQVVSPGSLAALFGKHLQWKFIA